MANKTLHSLQFPGLSDVYVVPEEAQEFSTSSTYAVGQYVTYRGILYKCITAVTNAGSWTGATNWSATDVGTELRSIDFNHYTKTEEDLLLAAKQNTLTFDNFPTSGSVNPVKSDGIFNSRVPMYGMGKNLLDNWYFGNPINQRGESSYVAAANTYTIDRWYCNQPRGNVTIGGSAVQLTKTATGSFQFIQKIKAFNAPCTFSVLLSVESVSGINIAIVDTNGANLDIVPSDAINGKQLVTCYYDGTGATSVDRVVIAMSSGVAANTSIILYAVKLELGDQQTLCHNEGTSASPVWVLNDAQDQEKELYRCKTSTADSSDIYSNKVLSTNIPNKNLIDNWYFVGGGSQLGDGIFPINQRGKTTYTMTEMAIDRWYGGNNYGNTQIISNGVTITGTNNFHHMQQMVINGRELLGGKTVTLSGLTSSGELLVKSGIVPTEVSTTNIIVIGDVGENGGIMLSSYGDPICVAIRAQAGKSITLAAIKLELGTEQTLCHNEGTDVNPVWVLNEIPDYEEEYYRCITSNVDSTDTYANQKVSNITIQCNSVGSSSLRYYNKLIRSTHKVLDSYFSNPTAQASNITVTTSDGYLDFSNGFVSGVTTNITLVLGTSGPVLNTTTTAP